MDNDALDAAISADLQDAAIYCDTELGPLRAAAIHYYHARKFGDEEEGRSTVVMPIVRDTIRATLPSLMKKFFGSRQVVTFSPGSTTGGEFADDATATVNFVFTVQNSGYEVLWGAFKDALRSKTGWLKWWWDESIEVKSTRYTGVSEDQLEAAHATLKPTEQLHIDAKTQVGTQTVMMPARAPPAAQPPEDENSENPAEEASESPQDEQNEESAENQPNPAQSGPAGAPPGAPASAAGGPQMVPQQVPVYEYTIHIVSKSPRKRVRVANVPPDEIIFTRDAFSLDSSRIIAHRTRKTRGELVAMGVPRESLEDVTQDDVDSMTNIEFLARQTITSGVIQQASNSTWDQVMVPYYECYYRVDADGDGISELRKVCKLGVQGDIVSNEIWNEVPLALLCPDPEPHVMVGNSQADFIMDMQNIGSHVWRDVLDSLKQSIFPRTAYVEGQANVDDILNTEIGAAIRMRAPGMVTPFVTPFTGESAFPIFDRLDQVREQRTGIGNSAMALDGSALQSTTPVAAQATVSASQQQVDLTARMFAHGVSRMFRGVLRLLCEHQDEKMQFQLNGRTFNVNPMQWDPDMHAIVDTGLGVGNNDVKLSTLATTNQAQKEVIQQFGPENPLCGLKEYYNTLQSLLETAGIRDTHRYWRDPDVSKAQGIVIQPPAPTPEQIIAQSQEKIESAKLDKDKLKIILDDQRQRDQMESDEKVKLADIAAKHGSHFDSKHLDAMQAQIQSQRDTAEADAKRQMEAVLAAHKSQLEQIMAAEETRRQESSLANARMIADANNQTKLMVGELAAGHAATMQAQQQDHELAMEKLKASLAPPPAPPAPAPAPAAPDAPTAKQYDVIENSLVPLMSQVVTHLSKPKKVVRDNNGKIIGVE